MVQAFKIQLLLAGAPSTSSIALRDLLEEEAARWRAATSNLGLIVRHGIRAPDDPFAQTEQGSSAQSFGVDGFLELADSGGAGWHALMDAVAGTGQRLGQSIESTRSAAVAGVEHAIVPGDQPLLLVYALRRLSTMSHEQFCDYWLNRHAAFGRQLQVGRGYRQLHADPTRSAEAAAAAGVAVSDLDGVAEAYFPDIEGFTAGMARPEVAADAMEDEKRFIDHSRSAGALIELAGERSET